MPKNARFERAYTKLGSELVSDRISAVTQLSGLLHADGGARDEEVLNALINQFALGNKSCCDQWDFGYLPTSR